MHLDVAIVGASSAGLFAAELLARAGRRVAVFERQPALNHARRTYIITPQIARVLGAVPPGAVLHQTPRIALRSACGAAEVALAAPDLIVERQALALGLAERAERAGAAIHYGHRLTELVPGSSGVALRLARRGGSAVAVSAAAVIGADGVFSAVGQAAGLPRPPVVQIIQAEVALPRDYDPQVTTVWFEAAETPYFYWLIPEGDERGVLGVIAASEAPTRGLLDGFLQRQQLRPLAYQAAQVAMHHPGLRPYGRLGAAPLFLVGDAAGQVKVTTVGGTVTGLYGAQAAVRCLLDGVSPARAFAAVSRELDVHWWVRRALDRLDNRGYDRLLAQLSPAVCRFLAHHNRDEMAGALWRLPLLRPQLLALGLATLLRPGSHSAVGDEVAR